MTLVKFANGAQNKALNPFTDVFENFFNDSFISDRLSTKVPAVNIAETENDFHIELAAPGLNKEDFKINLDKYVLSVSAEKKAENNQEGKRYNKREYSYSSFVRSFTLPETADQERISAEYVNGILKITVAKKEEAKSLTREISIK
jgi:HSP20 family protein